MTTDRDTARVVQSWLRVDEHENADRILEDVLAALDTTPQRRRIWPAWRMPHMNPYAKLAIAAAAVVLVAVVGLRFLPGGDGPGGSGVTPTPVTSPTPTPPDFPPAGKLAVGRHSMKLEGVRFTFEIATSNWSSNGEFSVYKGLESDNYGFIFWKTNADAVYSDPCGGVKDPAVASTAAEMAEAIAGIPGVEVLTEPTAVTVGGKPAQLVAIRIPDPVPCPPDQFNLWFDTVDDSQSRYASEAGSIIRVWNIEVNGKRVQIDGETPPGTSEPGGDILAIVNSIQFE